MWPLVVPRGTIRTKIVTPAINIAVAACVNIGVEQLQLYRFIPNPITVKNKGRLLIRCKGIQMKLC